MIHSRIGMRGLRTAAALWFAFSIIGLGLTFSDTLAGSHRHHEAHEHGLAGLNVAVEGRNLYIELSSPAANIVGFEHRPRTQQQKAAVADALQKLKRGDRLFLLPPASASRLMQADVDTDIDHGADHHEKTGHAGEQNRHSAEKEKHHAADEHERHSEFKAMYHFVCEKPNELSQIKVQLFSLFPGIEHIEVQLLTGAKQTAMELTAEKHTILF